MKSRNNNNSDNDIKYNINDMNATGNKRWEHYDDHDTMKIMIKSINVNNDYY